MAEPLRLRRTGVVALFAALTLGPVGCASVPSSSPVYEDEGVRVGRGSDSYVRLLAEAPKGGDGPVDVVRGFLAASASFENDHQVARGYLTPEMADSWDPGAIVRVYDGEPRLRATDDRTGDDRAGDDTVEFEAGLEAVIDGDGEFTPARPTATANVEFGLRKVAGEWRIETLPDGLLLTGADVSRAFRPVSLFFLTPDEKSVVPAPVFLRAGGPGLATTLVNALLAGPTSWLAPAVRSAFPPGTALTRPEEPLDTLSGLVTVDLTDEALDADRETRRAMAAQLVWTLRQLSEVSAVRVTVEGANYDIPDTGAVVTRESLSTYDSGLTGAADAYLVRDGGLVSLATDEGVPGPAGSGRRPLRDPAVSLRGDKVAGLSSDQRTVYAGPLVADQKLGVVLRGGRFSSPSWDRYDGLWVVEQANGSGARALLLRPESEPLAVRLGSSIGSVRAMRVSRDGARMVLIATSGGATRLLVGRVVRSGGEVSVQGLRPIASQFTDIVDVAWADGERLAVLAGDASGPLQAHLVTVDGAASTAVGSVPGMTSIAAASGPTGLRPLLVGTEEGIVHRNVGGTTWQVVGNGRDPAYPG